MTPPPDHAVRLLPFPGFEEREKNLAEARFNVFNLLPCQFTFDMSSNTMNTVNREQLSARILRGEAQSGARNFENLKQNAILHRLRDDAAAFRPPRAPRRSD